MKLQLVTGDIVTTPVDAIVNAANSTLLGGGGVDGAIHAAAGPQLLAACRIIRDTVLPGGLAPGKAISTTAGELPAKWVIHTVGPVYSITEDRSETLASTYRESLRVAKHVGARTLAFPAISAGVYGWPMADATRIAVDTVRAMEAEVGEDIDEITFVAFDDRAARAFRAALDTGKESPHGHS